MDNLPFASRYSSKRLICAVIGVVWLLSSFIGAAQIIIGGVSNDEEEIMVYDEETYPADFVHRQVTSQNSTTGDCIV